ncbi:MAG: S26 family signal peptidase [Treponema sp.]|nr:S26 family signal peptidase [Treponema sp.]
MGESFNSSFHKTKKAHTGKAILGAFIAAMIMKFFFIDFMITEGHSMVPAIKPGSILIVCKAFYGIRVPGSGTYLIRWGSPEVGHVVVFYTPLGEIAVKRCGEILSGDVFYALGDNGPQSYDSRHYGPVPYTSIIGRVIGRE